MVVRVRDFHPGDLDGVLRLWSEQRETAGEPVYSLAEVLASCRSDHAVVAVDGGELVGAAVGRAARSQGWVVFVHAAGGGHEVAAALLAALEASMAPAGLSTLSVLLPEEVAHDEAFTERGFEEKKHLRYLERELPVQHKERESLAELGGRLLPHGLWDAIGGMTHEKDVLERQLVMPLAQPELADEMGVVPPRAVVLFGPPGTGKTTFAKAIASRLEWPFVEIFPSRLASDAAGLAAALRQTFQKVAELEHAVVFIDEVEEIAARRSGEPPSPLQGVTNELLKTIPAFREQEGRLLVCATNFVRALDEALLRHGRFDYVIPIGLPDADARGSIWARYVPAAAHADLDLAAVVAASDGFSPADIEYAARKASQRAFEAALHEEPGGRRGPATRDYLDAIRATRATVSPEQAAQFHEDIATVGRV
ncbi:ATP-binding protein [Aquipuribacter sp. MA13-6]|uniref:ATP-binding protein n=1 Tax=unclassified Aquipuribacter TaxID=2635084 RepID=UPI003EEF448A